MSTDQSSPKAMNIVLWIVQVLLGVAFGMAGFMKLTTSMADLTAQMVWPGDVPEILVRFIALSEVLGGIGLIVPALTKIKPILTVYAAWGLALVMLLAAFFHASRAEYPGIAINLIFVALSVFVAWGRTKKAPILAK